VKQKKDSTAIRLLLVFGGILVGLGMVEVALRLLEPPSNAQVLNYSEIQSGEYLTLIPGASGLITGREVNINAQGYRGRLYPYKKTAGKTRILFFGDSHTFSMGADDASTYPAVVEKNLNAASDRYEILNFGVLGHDLRQILVHIENNAYLYDPDVIIITFHSGDILESSGKQADAGAGDDSGVSLLYRLKRDALKYSYTARLILPYGVAIARRILGWSPGITTAELHEIENNGSKWRDLQEKILALQKSANDRGIRLAFVLFPSISEFDNHPARAVHRALESWLNDRQIPALDLLPYFSGQDPASLTASLLDKHPNERAYAIVGNAVSDFLTAGLITGQ